jgi:predicted MFS family arabinose efflux permease
MGMLAYFVSDRAIFFFVMLLAIPALWTLTRIRADDIDNELARGAARRGAGEESVAQISTLLKDRRLSIFLVCAVLFHFANAAMLPLLGEMLSKGHGRASMMFMSACVVTTQLVITLLASWAGVKAGEWGRKPLLLIGFSVLPIRGILYTLTSSIPLLVGIQVLDGIGAGIFGVVSVLVIADLTQGSGRFNLALGAITTAVGIGASLSQAIAGGLVHHFGFSVGFLFLAAVALAALVILYFLMPETRDLRAARAAWDPK